MLIGKLSKTSYKCMLNWQALLEFQIVSGFCYRLVPLKKIVDCNVYFLIFDYHMNLKNSSHLAKNVNPYSNTDIFLFFQWYFLDLLAFYNRIHNRILGRFGMLDSTFIF